MDALEQARKALSADVDQKEKDLAKAKDRLAKFDEILKDGDEPAKPKGKPGPKPKKAASSEDAAPKTTTEGKNRAAKGRRAVARGERPSLKDGMVQVMGSETCNAEEVAERLAKKGWTPDAKDPKQYIGYMLSSTKTHFERVPAKGRGFYRVKDGVKSAAKEAEPAAETKAAEAKAPEAKTSEANGTPKRKSTDDVLKEAGIDLGPLGS